MTAMTAMNAAAAKIAPPAAMRYMTAKKSDGDNANAAPAKTPAAAAMPIMAAAMPGREFTGKGIPNCLRQYTETQPRGENRRR